MIINCLFFDPTIYIELFGYLQSSQWGTSTGHFLSWSKDLKNGVFKVATKNEK
jgi:hypothetical protein